MNLLNRFVLLLGMVGLILSATRAAARTGGPYTLEPEVLDGGGGAQSGGSYGHQGSFTAPAGQLAGGAYTLAVGFLGQLDSIEPTEVPEIAVFNGASLDPVNERAHNMGSFHFGTVTVGGSGPAFTFTIRNSGSAELTGIVVSSTSEDFTVSEVGTSFSLSPGNHTTFTVRFTPETTGGKSAVVQIASNDADENPFHIPVTGSSRSPSQAFDAFLSLAGLSGDDASADAEPFADGVSNLLKYAFNMNLSGPDSATMLPGEEAGLPAITAQPNGANSVFRYEFVRRKNSGLTYTAQKSPDIVNPASWEGLTDTPEVISLNDDWERVIYEEPYDATTTRRCFGRVEVSLP